MDEQFRALPGVRAATVSDMPLVANWMHGTVIFRRSRTEAAESADILCLRRPAFFETMQIPIVLGRPIDSHDVDGAPLAAVVNEVFATKYFPNQNPIGRHFSSVTRAGDLTIVGVAKNARYNSLKDAIPPVAYLRTCRTWSSVRPACFSSCGRQASPLRSPRQFGRWFMTPRRPSRSRA